MSLFYLSFASRVGFLFELMDTAREEPSFPQMFERLVGREEICAMGSTLTPADESAESVEAFSQAQVVSERRNSL